MGSSSVSSVVNFFPQVNEGYSTTLQTTIAPGATTVGLQSAANLTNGSVFVGIIEPGGSNQQVFTGIVDTVGSQITGVKWTRGNNVTHNSGVTIVDYVTGTAINMITTGILKFASQTGTLNPTSIYDANGNKILDFNPTTSAVNRVQLGNTATGFFPYIKGIGSDTNVGLNFVTQGNDAFGYGLAYNGTSFRALPMDWVRQIWASTWTSTPQGSWSISNGTGWQFPSGNPAIASNGTGAVNDEIRYKIYLDAGTYTFTNWFITGTGKAIITPSIIDEQGHVTTFGTADCYNAGVVATTGTTTGVAIGYGGYYTFCYKATSKNASSSGYSVSFLGMQIWRTA